MKKINNIKGTKDILPIDSPTWIKTSEIIKNYFTKFGYNEIKTPIIEKAALFLRSIGNETDILGKEMYIWDDKNGEKIALRPELTAPVVRSFIQNNLANNNAITRLSYFDSAFRRERPQKGRQRQFYQFGIEAFGSKFPEQDAEVIAIAYNIYKNFGIKDVTVKINSLGSLESKNKFSIAISKSLKPFKHMLTKIEQTKLEKNPMRLFDSKDKNTQSILKKHAPKMIDFISIDDKNHFNDLQEILSKMNIPFVVHQGLVRGLDYYTRTAFEIVSQSIGAQDALCGGGRYDNLVESLGGKSTPAVGFAAGFERLLLLLNKKNKKTTIDIYLILIGEKTIPLGYKLATDLRNNLSNLKIVTETCRRSLKSQIKYANQLNARHTIIIGENELMKKEAQIKNMTNGEQANINLEHIVDYLKEKINETQ